MPAAGEAARALASYAVAALDALGWQWGPGHIELMLTPRGPRLVEVNLGRFNGIRFVHVADATFGANAYDLAVTAYLDGEAAWAAVPPRPMLHLRAGS